MTDQEKVAMEDAGSCEQTRSGLCYRPNVDILEKDDELERVRGDLLERKTFDFLFERATIHRVHEPRRRTSNIIVP